MCSCGWSPGFFPLVILMDVGLTGWVWPLGYCRAAGEFQSRDFRQNDNKLTYPFFKDCGIRIEGTSSASCQHAQQPKLDGKTRLRSRGKNARLAS
jgi:hypothetical protein